MRDDGAGKAASKGKGKARMKNTTTTLESDNEQSSQPEEQVQPSKTRKSKSRSASPELRGDGAKSRAKPKTIPADKGEAAKKTSKPKVKAGRSQGSQGYNESDTMALLTIVDEILPRGSNEWNQVRDLYNEQHAKVEGRASRTTESLKSRYRHVLMPQAPTGKTRCPATRELAVKISQRIARKVYNVTVDDEASMDSSDTDASEAGQSDGETKSQSQSDVNSCPSDDQPSQSSAAEAAPSQRQAPLPTATGLKRVRSSKNVPAQAFQRNTNAKTGQDKRVRRSGSNVWAQHMEEQAAHRERREIQQFLSVQNASLQEENNTALTNKLLALSTELDSKRDRIADLREVKQELNDRVRRSEETIHRLTDDNRRLQEQNQRLQTENERLSTEIRRFGEISRPNELHHEYRQSPSDPQTAHLLF
ncbi:hypothetical protein PR003_g26584 [Phytophthora rubi]|uniref:DUF6818 domain-containing protein n=2 Tax=Phytophthora rubi TaxID=129364 RepID=A0A6A3LB39_9STRA|nr:hypothetical protein PR001_g14882 [Phytophthora rubi]KAE9285431.1 hypothetical protein PR003_g26584 [Phytophthora rubi]